MIFHPYGVIYCKMLLCFVSKPHRGGMFIEKFNPKPQEPRRACPELVEGGEIMLLRKIELAPIINEL